MSRDQNKGPDDSVTSITRLNDGQWHHAVAVWDSGNKKIYIDGFLDFEEKVNGVDDELGNDKKSYCYIGSGSDQEDTFDGLRTETYYEGDIASIHAWETVFTDQQIKDIWIYQVQQEMGGLGRCEEFTAMDIVFVFDETISVNPTELEEAQQFCISILEKFFVTTSDPDLYTQIGVLSYAYNAARSFDLGALQSNGEVEAAIDAMKTQFDQRAAISLKGGKGGKKGKGDKDGMCCHGTAMLAAATQFKWRPAAERVIVYIMDGMNTQIGLGCVEENNRVGNLKLMKDTVDRVVPIAVVNTLPNVLFKIVSGAEHVSIDEVGCVTDGAGDHAANEKSEMKILVDGLLYTQFLDTGDCWVYSKYDYLQLNDNYKQVWQCHTEDGPDNVPVKAGDKLTWTTDGHAHGAGFVVCLTPDVVLTTEPKTEKVADEFLMSMSKGMPAGQPFFSVETFAELNTDEVIQQAQSITCGVHAAPTSSAPTRTPTGAPSEAPTKLPTRSPTFLGGCTADEWQLCDQSGNGVCSCGDAVCSFKACT